MEVSVVLAFVSGLVSFFAPCMVPLAPVYVTYISGVSLAELQKGGGAKFRRRLWLTSGLFVLGFSMVFVALGIAVAGLASFVAVHKQWLEWVGGAVLVLFGLHLGGWWRWEKLEREYRLKLPKGIDRLGYVKPVVVGMVFGGAWTPCIGPVLGAILTLSAMEQTVIRGAGLLLVYSIGVSVPFLILASLVAQSPRILVPLKDKLGWVEKGFGVVLVVVGLLLINNSLEWIAEGLTYNGLNREIFAILMKLGYKGY